MEQGTEKPKNENLLLERVKQAYSSWHYAITRIDLLIIAISGASIYTILEVLKIYCNAKNISPWLFKVAGFFFVFAIIINLISQMTGKNANWHDYIVAYTEIEDSKNKDKINMNDGKADTFTKCTNRLNITSLISMFVGMLLLIVAISIYF